MNEKKKKIKMNVTFRITGEENIWSKKLKKKKEGNEIRNFVREKNK